MKILWAVLGFGAGRSGESLRWTEEEGDARMRERWARSRARAERSMSLYE